MSGIRRVLYVFRMSAGLIARDAAAASARRLFEREYLIPRGCSYELVEQHKETANGHDACLRGARAATAAKRGSYGPCIKSGFTLAELLRKDLPNRDNFWFGTAIRGSRGGRRRRAVDAP